jgi:hypothetical protein
MNRRFALLLIAGSMALSPLLQAKGGGGHVHYVGGTVAELPSKAEGFIVTTGAEDMLFTSKGVTVRVPYGNITNIEYGLKAARRYAEAILISPLFLLSKKHAHYLTVDYTDTAGQQQAMVFQVAKDDIRSILVSLEARTGRKVEFQDEEARKAGKG